jgi:hypothetical protein
MTVRRRRALHPLYDDRNPWSGAQSRAGKFSTARGNYRDECWLAQRCRFGFVRLRFFEK